MAMTLRLRATVQPGGKIEIEDPELPIGESVDLIVLLPDTRLAQRESIVDVLHRAPGHILFKTREDVDEYINEERHAWDR